MKLTDKNFDIAGFKVSRLTRLLIILRVHAIGNWELQVGLKDGLLNLGKLWVQHHFSMDNIFVKRTVAFIRRSLSVFKRVLSKLRRN